MTAAATPAARFDAWVVRGRFTALDLGLYRILYAASALLLLPRPEAMSGLPDFLWRPPPGPLRLLDTPPPHPVLVGVTALEVVALVLVLLGLFTTASSIAAGLLYVVADGLGNGYGSIYHYILLGVVPLVLCWAGWGRRLSVDALRAARAGGDATPEPVPQWPLRLLALCIGVAFATAGIAKARAGWLDLDTQATRAHFVNTYAAQGSDELLAPLVARVDSRTFWELLDWATVGLELLLLVTVVSWALFIRSLPMLVAFHVGVLLVLNIAFAANVVVYAAFVPWSRWGERWGRGVRTVPTPGRAGLLVIGAGAAATSLGLARLHADVPASETVVKSAFVLVAAVVTVALCVRPRPATTTSG